MGIDFPSFKRFFVGGNSSGDGLGFLVIGRQVRVLRSGLASIRIHHFR
jgi:hypothetical protein